MKAFNWYLSAIKPDPNKEPDWDRITVEIYRESGEIQSVIKTDLEKIKVKLTELSRR